MTGYASFAASLSHRERLIIIIGLMTGLLLSALDQTIVATALPTIVGDFGGLNHLSWVVTAYLLSSTVSMPLFGKICDLYGRKRDATRSPSPLPARLRLVRASPSRCRSSSLARGLQGVGGGGIMSMTFTILGDIVSPRERGSTPATSPACSPSPASSDRSSAGSSSTTCRGDGSSSSTCRSASPRSSSPASCYASRSNEFPTASTSLAPAFSSPG